MGNSNSQQDGSNTNANDDDLYYDKFDGIETLGYRVLGVQPESPASKAGLVSFFDFLLGVNGQMLLGSGEGLEEGEEYEDVDLPALLRENLGSELELLVYNIKSQETRFVTLIPSDSWGGAGLLGVTIRLDNYGGAEERLIRVLSVEHNSPAAIAGLVPEQDYLLGTVGESLEEASSLANVLASHVDRVVEFYVYNTNSDVVRVVPIMPTWSWGGKGLLGAEVGTGYLHRLPHAVRATTGSSVARKIRYVQQGKRNAVDPSNPVVGSESMNDGTSTSSATAETCNLEHEPQLELESEEFGRPGTLASPEDIADMSSTNKNADYLNQRPRNGDTVISGRIIKTPTLSSSKAAAAAANPQGVVNTTTATTPIEDHESLQAGGLSGESADQRIRAAELFSGPPPPESKEDTEDVDLR